MEFMKTLPDNSIDLICTDPPYDIITNGGGYNQQNQEDG